VQDVNQRPRSLRFPLSRCSDVLVYPRTGIPRRRQHQETRHPASGSLHGQRSRWEQSHRHSQDFQPSLEVQWPTRRSPLPASRIFTRRKQFYLTVKFNPQEKICVDHPPIMQQKPSAAPIGLQRGQDERRLPCPATGLAMPYLMRCEFDRFSGTLVHYDGITRTIQMSCLLADGPINIGRVWDSGLNSIDSGQLGGRKPEPRAPERTNQRRNLCGLRLSLPSLMI